MTDSDAILAGADTDFTSCARAAFSRSACDRGIAKIDRWGNAIGETRSTMLLLTPPSAANQWHSDYLAFLDDASQWTKSIVAAYDSQNFDRLQTELARFDSFASREGVLSDRFEQIQRDLGAE